MGSQCEFYGQCCVWAPVFPQSLGEVLLLCQIAQRGDVYLKQTTPNCSSTEFTPHSFLNTGDDGFLPNSLEVEVLAQEDRNLGFRLTSPKGTKTHISPPKKCPNQM